MSETKANSLQTEIFKSWNFLIFLNILVTMEGGNMGLDILNHLPKYAGDNIKGVL